MLCIMVSLFCCGCGTEIEKVPSTISAEPMSSAENKQPEAVSSTEEGQKAEAPKGGGEKEGQKAEAEEAEEDSEAEGSEEGREAEEKGSEAEGSEEARKAETLQEELAQIEHKSCEYENADWGSMGQQEMNRLTALWYQLWDEELNSLWSRLSEELDAETKAKVLEEQRTWIKRKEANVRGAGATAFGGTLQPQLENSVGEEMTRARAYILAGYLADARGEAFTISPEIQESLEGVEVDPNEVFEKFEGHWIFDEERGACVGIERTESCDYGVEGSNWTVWVTGGDIISDLDVYGYTENSILFKTAQNGYDAFYELSFNFDNMLLFAYGTSLWEMDDVIVCE